MTPLGTVIEAVRDEAKRAGVVIAAMELIGLLPRNALATAGNCQLQFENFNDELIVENRLEHLL